MRRTTAFGFVVFSCVLAAVSTGAQQPAANAAPASDPLRGYLMQQFTGMEENFVRLAKAIPPEKFSWRPAEGVRSISEVLLHVAGANYGFPVMLGTNPPPGIDRRGFEKQTTEKDKVIEALQASYRHAIGMLQNVGDEQMKKPLKLFGRETVGMEVLLVMNHHMHEHMGQLIAYARTNGVTPPWTEDRQRQQAQPASRPPQ